MKKAFTLFAIVTALAMAAVPAFADKGGHHHKSHWKNHHHHNHHYGHHHKPYKSGVSISINSGWPASYYHHYYPSYYSVAKPIYVTQPVIVQPVQQVIFASNAPGYQNDYGQYCREYNALIFVGGQKQSGYGTACYQPDGSWKVVN